MTNNPLGSQATYPSNYSPDILYPIPRWAARSLLEIDKNILMYGIDHWQAYEISWLDSSGKPQVAIGEFFFNSDSENIVESKSLKLYLNSLNHEKYCDISKVQEVIAADLSSLSRSEVKVVLSSLEDGEYEDFRARPGRSIDGQKIVDIADEPDAAMLKIEQSKVDDELLYTDLFRSNCPVTGQPDWASFEIRYSGNKICEASLLAYLCSFRRHQAYHEECAERIFRDITCRCEPEELWVAMNFLRRGGLDINVYRSSVPLRSDSVNSRRIRQ